MVSVVIPFVFEFDRFSLLEIVPCDVVDDRNAVEAHLILTTCPFSVDGIVIEFVSVFPHPVLSENSFGVNAKRQHGHDAE